MGWWLTANTVTKGDKKHIGRWTGKGRQLEMGEITPEKRHAAVESENRHNGDYDDSQQWRTED